MRAEQNTVLIVVVMVLFIVTAVLAAVYTARQSSTVAVVEKAKLSQIRTKRKYVIYILCYDENTERIARNDFGHFGWAKIVYIPSTFLFENVLFDTYLPAHVDEWSDADYVGTLSWKAPQKIGMPDIFALDALISSLQQTPDAITFFNISNKDMVKQTSEQHPKFKHLWTNWLSEMGFPPSIAQHKYIPYFVCNYWIAKPASMVKYIQFFKRAKNVLLTSPTVHDDLWSNSMYDGKVPAEKLMKMVSREYYPYHAFLLERLPCFYFWVTNMHVMPFRTAL